MKAPKWTAEAPTEPGLYWYALIDSDGALHHQKVCEHRGEMCVINTDAPVRVEQMHRVWAGPLRSPEGERVAFVDRLKGDKTDG